MGIGIGIGNVSGDANNGGSNSHLNTTAQIFKPSSSSAGEGRARSGEVRPCGARKAQ